MARDPGTSTPPITMPRPATGFPRPGQRRAETDQSSFPSLEILGVRVHTVTMKETLDALEAMASNGGVNHVVTVNPEFIMTAREDEKFRQVLNRASLSLPDGIGVVWAGRLLGSPLSERVTGADLLEQFAGRAARRGFRFFLLGAAPGVAERAAAILTERHPGLVVAGTYAGSPRVEEEEKICERIRATAPHALFVAYGSPHQDLWIDRNKERLGVPVSIGVGGTLDYIAGVVPRAPRWMREIGLEWLYRLRVEPRRWRRMLALPRFAWQFLHSRNGKPERKDLKNLTILSSWVRKLPIEERSSLERSGVMPRDTIFEKLIDTVSLDGNFLKTVPRGRRALYRLIPPDVALALEAYVRRRNHRVVITWTDTGALLFAFLLKLTRRRHPHVAMMFWISKPKKAFLLKMVYSHIDRIVLWTSAHRDFAINRLGIPPSKITYIPHYVDQEFWRPVEGEGDMICSAGREMRDYPTLVKAMRDIPIRCHIAAGLFRDKMEPTVKAIYRNGPLPPNVTAGKLPPHELRDLYARSRFVVIPLLPSDSDNGLNVILESMAMGKAVICSRTAGQRDVITEGENGIFVPLGDPEALRKAIMDLWANPARAARMGEAGRRFIEKHHTLDAFVAKLREVVDEVAASYNGHSGK